MGPAQSILYLHRAFMEPSEAQGSKVQIPLAVIDLGETDVFLAQGLTDIHSLLVPAGAGRGAYN